MVNNGKFIVNRVTYDEGLKHNLISISQLVVRNGNQALFDEEGSVISKKESKEVLLKSKRKGGMFTSYIKLIIGIPFVCLLSMATFDLSWLWNRRISHSNFKLLNKLFVNDLVLALPVLKFDNDSLSIAYEQGK